MQSKLLSDCERGSVRICSLSVVDNLLRELWLLGLQERHMNVGLTLAVPCHFQRSAKCIVAEEECTSALRKLFFDRQSLLLDETLILVEDFIHDCLRSVRASETRVLGVFFDQGTLLSFDQTTKHVNKYKTLNLASRDAKSLCVPVLKESRLLRK